MKKSLKKVIGINALICVLTIPAVAAADWSINTVNTPQLTENITDYSLHVNDSNRIAGYVSNLFVNSRDEIEGELKSFITGSNGAGITEITTSIPGVRDSVRAINNLGKVAGDSNGRLFTSAIDGQVNILNIPLLNNRFVSPGDINNSGQLVGRAIIDSNFSAFTTGPNGVGVINLNQSDWRYSNATTINDSGQVAGWFQSSTAIGDYLVMGHAFITGPNAVGITDIGTLYGRNYSQALDINESGQAIGIYFNKVDSSGPSNNAFITGPNGSDMTALGTLGGRFAKPTSINDAGQVVGWAQTADGHTHGFIYTNGGMIDLNLLDAVVSAGWTDIFPTDINNNGLIVGSGLLHGQRAPFMLHFTNDTQFTPNPIFLPVPEPSIYMMLLAGLGLLGFVSKRHVNKKFI